MGIVALMEIYTEVVVSASDAGAKWTSCIPKQRFVKNCGRDTWLTGTGEINSRERTRKRCLGGSLPCNAVWKIGSISYRAKEQEWKIGELQGLPM